MMMTTPTPVAPTPVTDAQWNQSFAESKDVLEDLATDVIEGLSDIADDADEAW